jgi:gamma-glutamylcyclotransferase (GGCT)/AIG2-like uncharacterized protein YtfP
VNLRRDPAAVTSALLRVAAARLGAHDAPDPDQLAAFEAELEAAFACSRRLAVYGTLAPGECNHDQLAGIAGEWTRGEVRGRRTVRRYPAFTWDPQAPPQPVQLFVADDLPRHWPRLDAFEGLDYRRILVPVTGARGQLAVANLYVSVVPVAT